MYLCLLYCNSQNSQPTSSGIPDFGIKHDCMLRFTSYSFLLCCRPENSDEHKLPKTSKMSSKSEDEDFNWEDDSEDMDEEDECGGEEEDDEDDDNDTNADDKGSHLSNDDMRSNNSDVTDASLSTVTRRVGQLGILDEGFEKVSSLLQTLPAV